MTRTILQITDCHLFADPLAKLKEICTRTSLELVLAQITRQFPHVERLVITGDLAHDERVETYYQLRDLLHPWQTYVRLLPGNHDNRQGIVEAFGNAPSASAHPRAPA